MTKFDHKSNLPDIFYYNDLSILPITRGTYMISKFDAYNKLRINHKLKPKRFVLSDWIQSINKNDIYSESASLNCAFVSGMLNDVINEDFIELTISGRMSTSAFEFYINTSNNRKAPVYIDRSQCEIDGGYEGLNKLMIIEAKNFMSDDFLIRQLYYPYRLWNMKLNGHKEIVPVFLVYSNGVFHFFIYKFSVLEEYSSLELLTQKSYVIADEPIAVSDIENLMNKNYIVKEPKVPFPQADTFERVIDLLEVLYEEGTISMEDISLRYDFHYRQAQYYTNAGRYIGLIKKVEPGVISLSQKGNTIMAMTKKERYLNIAKCIFEHEVFYLTLEMYLKNGYSLTKREIYKYIMKPNEYKLYRISGNTVERRSSSVKSWVEWIIGLIER